MLDEMHVEARRYADHRKAGGAAFDKKQLRWNEIVAVGEFYHSLGADGMAGVREAVDACVIGDPQHIPGGSVLSMIQPWMVADA